MSTNVTRFLRSGLGVPSTFSFSIAIVQGVGGWAFAPCQTFFSSLFYFSFLLRFSNDPKFLAGLGSYKLADLRVTVFLSAAFFEDTCSSVGNFGEFCFRHYVM